MARASRFLPIQSRTTGVYRVMRRNEGTFPDYTPVPEVPGTYPGASLFPSTATIPGRL